MQILIEIPNPPKRQEIVDIPLHFIDGDVCEAGGYEFKVLLPHGRLIDFDRYLEHTTRITEASSFAEIIFPTTILEAEEV